MEAMVAATNIEMEVSKEKSAPNRDDEDDAKTEPPDDLPTSGQIFYPMPQPGPEVDCVRDQLVQYDAAWEMVKQTLTASTTAYGFPIHIKDLHIHKDKTMDNHLEEVNGEFKSE